MSTRTLLGVKTAFIVPKVRKIRSLNLPEPLGPPRPVAGHLYLYGKRSLCLRPTRTRRHMLHPKRQFQFPHGFPSALKMQWVLGRMKQLAVVTSHTKMFNLKTFYVLPTQCVYVFCVDLSDNSRHSYNWLRDGRSGDRIPVGGRFSAPVQTGLGAHPTSYTTSTGFLFPGVKRPGREVNHPLPSSAEVKAKVELYFYSSSRPSWPVLGRNLYLPLLLYSFNWLVFITQTECVYCAVQTRYLNIKHVILSF